MIGHVGIVAKPSRHDLCGLVKKLVAWLEERRIQTHCDKIAAEYLGLDKHFDRANLTEDFDLMVILGGDGTLLSAARGVGPREIPLLAVNLGGLGFMMTTSPGEVFLALQHVLDGDYRIQNRSVIAGEVIRDGETVAKHYGLNDIVLNKAAIARLLHLQVLVNDELMSSYRADGLILCTPTGSTAYSLAAGGPVIAPSVEGFCITPICPHALSNRPVVVPETARIEIRLEGGDESTFLSIDGQVGVQLRAGDSILASRANHRVRIIQPQKLAFFDVLRAKMTWGE